MVQQRMGVYLLLTPITHTNTETEVFTHRLAHPPTLSQPIFDLFIWPHQGFPKAKGQSGQISPPVADHFAWKPGLNSHYCFPMNSIHWICLFASSNNHFLTWEIIPNGDNAYAQLFCPFVEHSGIRARLRWEVHPLSPCPAGSSAVWAMQRRRRRECEVPLAVPGPTMSWLCGMWDMHSLLCGSAE